MEENKNIPKSENDTENDDFVIGKGFRLEENEEQPQKHVKRKKKGSSTVKNIIWIIAIVLVSVGLAFSIIYAGADFMGLGFGRGENKCEINIEMGTPASKIADQLEESGAVKIPMLFRIYAKFKGMTVSLNTATITLKASRAMRQFAKCL